ncbi:ABC transporter ATP-binding protein [Maridesulfovibrio ferrireducens]|uniref:ABC transporter ATP-binding protein n=1 Tax=Maridesulfovibrio ferrireducens TaxID=246191 RepID=UPI001A1FF257|nr:ABC transporter ATP-binding protein [Maridesulfovibrio ferrireducens]MBI9113098.1 ABC transporter ATP-binding protein [Maridesulfovibrio ferrireducens]
MIFELRDVHARYGKTKTLNGVSLSLKSKEVVCLLGPNGAGKSTLFKGALGFIPFTHGQTLCNGEDLSRWSRAKIAQTIGYIPQSHIPTFQYKAINMVLMGRTAHLGPFATPSAKDMILAEEAMEKMNISHLRNTLYTEMSGGQRQLILIARALAQSPKFLIMDEPTNNLDFGNQVLVLRHIQALAEDGLGVIMASHYPDHAFQYASKVVLIKGGKIVGSGTPEETATEEQLNALYNVKINIADAYLKDSQNSIKVCIPAVYNSLTSHSCFTE